jgi:hypothetical protein
MTSSRDEEIAASLGAHRDLGPGYDEAIASGLVERIGAEVDRRVDERISQRQRGNQPATGQQEQHLPAAHLGNQISWQQASLALGSMVIGAITSASIGTANGNGTWPIIFVWLCIVVINLIIFRRSRPSRHDRRSPD